MTATQRDELISRRARLVTLRDKAYATLEAGLDNAEIDNYTWQDAEGGHTVRRRNPKDLRDLIDGWESDIAYIDQRLSSGGGLHNFTLRRIP